MHGKGRGFHKSLSQRVFYAERGTAEKLLELSSIKYKFNEDEFDTVIKRIGSEDKLELAQLQIKAVREAVTNGVLVITGGPGTGKNDDHKSDHQAS